MTERRENSGLIDLDALLKQAEPAAPVVEPPRAVPPPGDSLEAVSKDVASSPKIDPPAPAPAAPAPAIAPPSQGPRPRPTLPATPTAKRRAPAPKPKTAGIAALGMAIIAGLIAFAVSRAPSASAPASTATPAVAIAPAAANVEAKPIESANASEAAIDPNALPAAVPAAPTSTARVAAVAAGAARSASTATAKGADEANVALGEVANANEQATGDLGNAMRSVVGDRATNTVTKDESAGSGAGQVRPSQGAVVGAINSVLPGARACLGPDDAVRSALVVFKSDGSVKSVELRGSKDEDACVKGELAKARVAPFADDTFSTRVTVRP